VGALSEEAAGILRQRIFGHVDDERIETLASEAAQEVLGGNDKKECQQILTAAAMEEDVSDDIKKTIRRVMSKKKVAPPAAKKAKKAAKSWPARALLSRWMRQTLFAPMGLGFTRTR
jgi:hypothetical protein